MPNTSASDLSYLTEEAPAAGPAAPAWQRKRREDLSYLLEDDPSPAPDFRQDPVARQAAESLSVTADMNPDVEAGRQQLAKDTGMPLPVVREQEDAVRKRREAPDIQELWDQAPRTLEYLSNPDNAAVARDDTQNLSLIERIVKKMESYKGWSIIKTPRFIEKPVRYSEHLSKVFAADVLATEHNIKYSKVNYERLKKALFYNGLIDMSLESEAAALEKNAPQPWQDANLVERTVSSVGSMLPYSVHSAYAAQATGLLAGLAGGTIAAGGALVLGSAGPQAAVPEEAITVPTAFRGGFKFGYKHGTTAGALRQMFITEAGLAYGDFAKITDVNGRPIDSRIAAAAALAYGLGAAPLEHYGLKNIPGGEFLLGKFSQAAVRTALKNPATRSALKNIVLKWGRGIGAETLTEVAQEALQVLAGEAAKSVSALSDESRIYPGEGLGEFTRPETWARLSEVAVDTMLATAVMGAPGAVVTGINDTTRSQAAKTHAEDMNALFDAVENGKLKQRSAEIAQAHLLAVGAGDDVFISPEFFQTDSEAAADIAAKLGLDPGETQRLVEDGLDVKVPYAAVMAKLDPEAYQKINRDLKPSPGAMTLREAEAFDEKEAKTALGERYERIRKEVAPVVAETARIRKEAQAAGYAKNVVDDIMRGLLSRFTARHQDPVGFLSRIHVAGGLAAPTVAPFTQGQVYNQAGEIETGAAPFATWFKQSKVVDESGKPLMVLHGTKEDISEFDPHIGSRHDSGWLGKGFYFTSKPDIADYYADAKTGTGGARVMPVYLSLQNPYYATEDDKMRLTLEDKKGRGEAAAQKFREDLIAKGHDGVVLEYGYDKSVKEFVAFEPTQIKSVFNRGTWSPTDPNILYQTDRPTTRYTQAWANDFPRVTIHTTSAVLTRKHKALHEKAKAGDFQAARELVAGVIKPERIRALAAAHPDAVILPVLAEEESGRNKLPLAYAMAIEDIGGLPVSRDIVQANVAGHTGKGAIERLFTRVDYAGDVRPGQEYILADDIVTSGGTLNDLRLYIESKGGKVVDVTALGFSKGSTVLAAKPETLAELERKHDRKELENILAEYGAPGNIQSLTESQARYLATFASLDRLRNKLAKTGIRGRLSEKQGVLQAPGLSPADDKTFYQLDVSQPAPPFYSQLIQTIESDKFPNQAAPAEMAAVIESWVKKGLLKEEEVQWSGVVEWLKVRADEQRQDQWVWKKAQEFGKGVSLGVRKPVDKVTKAEVLGYLRANAVEVTEVRAGAGTVDAASEQEIADARAELFAAGERYAQEMKAYERILTEGGLDQVTALKLTMAMGRDWNKDEAATAEAFKKAHEVNPGYDWDRLYDRYEDVQKAEKDLEEAKESARWVDTKFEKYTLEGGEKYREMLLTLPAPSLTAMGREAYNAAVARQEKRGGAYESSHWDTPNVLAHMRFNERTGPNGEKILFIEEIQSDWHQAGRKKGYFAPGFTYQAYVERPDGYQVIVGHGKTGREALDDAISYLGISDTSRTKKSDLKLRRVPNIPDKLTVPDAPFKKSWPLLAVKRMVRWAAENGFDQLAWTPGAVQAERYDLSKQVSSIESAGREDAVTGEKSRSVTINLKNTPSYIELGMDNEGNIDNATQAEFKDKHLSDVIGKEMADRVLSGPETAVYSGEGLKVGGEGMKTFYDKILPAEIKKFFGKKAWGSPRVGKTEVPTVVHTDYAAFADWAEEKEGVPFEEIPPDVYDQLQKEFKGHAKKQDVWSIPITPQMKEKAVTEGLPLFQDEESPKPRGSVRVVDNQYLISLFKGDRPGQGANLSTLMHELGHVFFLEMESLVASGQADEEMVKDFEALRNWIGLAPGQAAKREDHEKWARGFEAYLAEGKAPDPTLEGVFFRFKQWLGHVYESVQQILGPDLELNDDVRRVFDRMLGDRRQVEAAAYEAGMTMPATEQLDALGVVADDRSYMRRLLKQAQETAERNMTTNRDANLKETANTLRRQAVTDVKQDPVRLQASAIRKSGGLDRAILVEMFGPEVVDQLPAGLVRKKGGLIPEMAANMPAASGPGLGPLFTSPHDMVTRLSQLQPLDDAVNTRFDELMALHDAKHAAVDYLLETDEYAAFLEILAKYEGRGQVKTAPRAQFRAYAKSRLDTMEVADAVRHDRFMAYMRKHQRTEAEKAAANKLDEAAAANELVRLNFEMAGMAVKNRKEMEALERRVKQAVRNKNIDYHYRVNIHILAHRFGLVKKAPAPDFVEKAGTLESLLTDDIGLIDNSGAFDEWLVGGAYTTPYKKLTMAQLRQLANLTAFLTTIGRQKKAPTLSNGTLVADAISRSTAETAGLKKRKVHRRGGNREALQKGWNGYQAMSESIPFLAIELGGYQNVGPEGVKSYTEEVLADPLRDSKREEIILWQRTWETARPHVETIHQGIRRLRKEHGRMITVPGAELPAALRHAGQDGWWSPDQIFAVVHNLGNQDNIDRLKDGYGLKESDLDALTAMLTEEEVHAVQGLWNTYDSLYDRINDVHMEMKGYPMNRVAALPRSVTVKGGKQVELKGGYAPIRYDRTLNTPGSLQVARFSEREELMAQAEAVYQVPATKSGFTMVRKKSVKLPLSLSMDIATEHLRDTIHYITHAAAVRDVQKVLFNNEYGAHVAEFLNPASYEAMQMSLRHIAQPRAGEQDWFSRKLGFISPMVTAFTLGWNASVMLKQWFSSPAAMVDIGVPDYLGGQVYMFGLKDYIEGADITLSRNWYTKYHQILELSPKMRSRAEAVDADLRRKVQRMRFNDTYWGRLNEFFTFDLAGREFSVKALQESAFMFIRMVDALTVMPIWHGSLKKGLRKFDGDLQKAIAFADEIVDRTQPSGEALELTQWQRSKVAKYFIRFVSFTVGKYAQRRRVHWRAMRQGRMTKLLYGWHTFLEAILPPMLMQMLFAVLQGRPLPWEEDDEGEDAIWDYGKNILAYWLATGKPLVQDLVGAFSAPLETPISTAGQIAKRNVTGVAKAFEDGFDDEAFKQVAWNAWEFISLVSRLPMSRVAEKVQKGLAQDTEKYLSDTPVKYVVPAPRR